MLVSRVAARDGGIRWQRAVPGWTWSQPAVLGDAVFVGAGGTTGYQAPRRAASPG